MEVDLDRDSNISYEEFKLSMTKVAKHNMNEATEAMEE